ncbi:glycerol-3-phosphate responsive antiterminator [Halothermothrix orenii]|uniref:Glycerol-3-phosphate responsive antiterminator n=1 Tax=Halothermothrix orenii (strain H 168 / OCM 544 / DSM 9562) TaxID=373903 RepID=B8CWA1_HALOH|nr:glycerol-3-phosphate responsive antiterminator [Halothermothrix orenii]ACL69570.1 glycerol-3-phosphate responsive antiterminator [Halothermothrix orenii H 168]
MKHLKKYFKKHPVIAGIRDTSQLNFALSSDVIALFILCGDIFILPEIMEKARERDKLVFLHIDLINGIGRDKKGIKYLAVNNLCDGIVTTKSNLIKAAKKEGLMAIQRLFLLDSAALKTGEHLLEMNKPDAVEILPGIAAPYFIEHIKHQLPCPIIAGGLIRRKEEIDNLVDKGVLAVSTSNKKLWKEY